MAQPTISSEQPARESDECHFFKLAPELRVTIYEIIFSTFDFDGKEDEDKDDCSDEDETEQNGGSENEADEDMADENEADEDEAFADVEHENGDSEDEVDENEEHEAGSSEGEDDDGVEDDKKTTRSKNWNQNPQLTRPPLLDVCQVILKEAVPLYNDRLAMMAAESTRIATDALMEEKVKMEFVSTHPMVSSLFTRSIVHTAKIKLGYSRKCVGLINDEVRDFMQKLAVETSGSKKAQAAINKAMMECVEAAIELCG